MHKFNTLTLITLFMAVAFSTIAAATLQNGLIVYYPFDETAGKTASDNSNNNNDGELMGSAAWALNEGKIEGSLRLDGGDGSVVDDNGADYINGLEAFSASIWVKSDSVPHDRGIFIAKDPAGGDDSFTLRYDSAGWKVPAATSVIKAGFTTTGGGIQYESADNTQTTEWQHLLVTWSSGNKLALYIDGKLDEPQYNNDVREGSISTATKLIIGKGGKDNGGTSWIGLIDEVRIYDRVLDMDEIEELSTGVLPVEAKDKLATTWALQKKMRF
jgi:hypothetical protein